MPTWSPDGTKIAFMSSRDGNPESYLINVDATGQTNLTNSPGMDAQLSGQEVVIRLFLPVQETLL